MRCHACSAGFPDECYMIDNKACDLAEPVQLTSSEKIDTLTHPATGEPIRRIEGKHKDSDELKDPKSTGRKRAAELYPLTPGLVCEWAGLKKAGGGPAPIIGCTGRPATHRHHGPDKDTTNNSPGNVHRICTHCHNTWHGANDPIYETYVQTVGDAITPHDGETRATLEEIYMQEKKREVKK